jgi:hypothetical protein
MPEDDADRFNVSVLVPGFKDADFPANGWEILEIQCALQTGFPTPDKRAIDWNDI